jgi:WD40 repeat protein
MLTASFSNDGALVATGGRNGHAHLWHADDGRWEQTLKIGEPDVWGVAFSPDNALLATASELTPGHHGTLNLWSVAGGSGPVNMTGFDNGLRTVSFSPDGQRIVTGGFGSFARVMDVPALHDISGPLPHNGWVQSAVFSRNGDELLTASKDGHIRIWRTSDWRPGPAFPAQEGRVFSATYSHDGRRIVSSSESGEIKLWEPAASGYEAKSLIPPESEKHEIWTAVFSPDDRWILTPSFDKTAHITSAALSRNGRIETIAVLRGHTSWVRSAAFSPDGRRVVTASQDGTARIWPVFPQADDLIRRAATTVPRCLHPNERRQLGFDPEPPAWCITGVGDKTTKDPATWQPKWPFDSPAWRSWLQLRQAGKNPALPGE